MLPSLCSREPSFKNLEGERRHPPLVAVAIASSLVGALVSALVGHSVLVRDGGSCKLQASDATSSQHTTEISFGPSRAEDALGELTTQEVLAVTKWWLKETGGAPARNSSPDCLWLAGPSAVELLFPPKAAALAYLDGVGLRPARYARVTAVGPGGIREYSVGPLEGGAPTATAQLTPLGEQGDIPYAKRPTEGQTDMPLATPLLKKAIQTLGAELLEGAFGPIFQDLEGFTNESGVAAPIFRNDVLTPAGERRTFILWEWVPAAPARVEASWLHVIPLLFRLNTTSRDSGKWSVLEVFFCHQGPFHSAEALKAAYSRGEVRVCPFKRVVDRYDWPMHETAPSPAGLFPKEAHGGVEWGPWSFTVTSRPSTGPALLDVRFRGERVLYELSLQDAQAGYSGSREFQFFYSDASWSLTMLGTSLEPGVDCPEGAHYISAWRWLTADGKKIGPSDAEEFWPACIFEWVEDHTIWRHMQNSDMDVRGLLRRTVVVRSITTVGNYDYITDFKFREDGEIEVHTRFAGYIESRYFNSAFNPEEANYSTIVRPDLAGPVHSHAVSFKADIDVAGVRANAMRVTKVGTSAVQEAVVPEDGSPAPLLSKTLLHQYVSQEGIGNSTFVANPHEPGLWSIVDRAATSSGGNPRGYAIVLSTWATTQVLPDSHPFTTAMPYTKYHLAVTRQHDSEYRATSPYVQFDGLESVRHGQDLDQFLSDEEELLDQDLVAWIGVGREHIVRQEDLPLVSNFGVGFSLQPWNFFDRNMAANP